MVRCWVTHLARSLLALANLRWISSGVVGDGATVISHARPVVALITEPRYLNPHISSGRSRRAFNGNHDALHRLRCARRHRNGRPDVAYPTERPSRLHTWHSSCCANKKKRRGEPATTRPNRKRAAATKASLAPPTKPPSRKFWARPHSNANAPSPPPAAAAAAATAAAVGGAKPASPSTSSGGRRFAAAATIRPAQSGACRPFGALGLLRQRDNDDDITSPPASGGRRNARRVAKRAPVRAPLVGPLLTGAWRSLMLLEGRCEGSWVGKASAHVLAGALASSHSVVSGLVVGLAVWASCAKRLTGSEDDWKLVARLTLEVAVLWHCHALPHGLGAGRPLRGNFGTGNAGDLLGACWHFVGQGAFIRLVAASGRLVRLNVLEANALLLGLSHLGNMVAGSRMRRVVGAAAQGILSATEREVVQKNGALASAFRDFAAQSANTLDAHSLGAVGARNLMGMGFIAARVRTFGRPALSLGWTAKANNMCMVGDPICGSLLQKLLDPTCVMLKGRGHVYDAYVARVGCLANQ